MGRRVYEHYSAGTRSVSSVHAYLKERDVPHIWNVDDEGAHAQDLGQ